MNKLIEEIEKNFDEKFKCIQNDCDGNGCIPNQVTEDEWEAQQCQFHAEYIFPIKSFLSSSLERAYKAGQEDLVGEIEKLRKDTENIEVPKGYNIGEYRFTQGLKNEGYNQALDDVLSFLSTINNKDK